MSWQEFSGGSIYLPPQEIVGVVHFLGGAFVATAPQLSYRSFLEQIGEAGFAIIATPFLNTFDHLTIAKEVLNRFENICDRLQAMDAFGKRYLPIYGIGHSMGCKLHLLIGSLFNVERAGNILISFNNYPAARAIPFGEQIPVTEALDLEFTPSPQETKNLISQDYKIARNLLIKFNNDTIDQTPNLQFSLQKRFPNSTVMRTLKGNHLTPLGQDVPWQTGAVFSPLDAIAQWFKQGLSGELTGLRSEVLMWLNPVAYM
ncbi:Protein of unknown function (DUF1350) [Xenococcus sp. PCC 7305]|uniref:DUF1350 family protein n=1 Tax=Xenococcus sp. PCC 7305 TaxID=102125 RepID=UPI0002ABC162|nr:DUF1350 family protein [Xenococcus sp. PCC 7305]ELS00323.1 Protein of unknown function (DUF1350) [Xenococcus sp. PCC 7305]